MIDGKFFRGKYRFIPLALIGIIVVSLMIISVILPAGNAEAFNLPIPNVPTVEQELATGITWVKTFDGAHVLTAQPTSDGGHIIFGTTDNGGMKGIYGFAYSYVYLFKVDSNGSMTWNRTFTYAKDDPTGSVSQTSDGGYIIADAIYKRKSGRFALQMEINITDRITDSDVLLIKIAPNGNTVWNRTFDVRGENASDAATSVLQTSDGGYMIGGVTSGDNFLLKTDVDGNKLWVKTFELGEHELNLPRLLQQTSDGYLIFGYAENKNSTWYAYFIKTDANENEMWVKIFDREEIGIATPSIQQTPDGDYMVVGAVSTQINIHTANERPFVHAYFLKMDANGNILKRENMSTELYTLCGQQTNSILQTSDGGYVFANEGACLIKIDADGNEVWEKQLVVGMGSDEIVEPLIYQSSDNGYMLIGNMIYDWNRGAGGGYSSGDIGFGGSGVIMIKADEKGNVENRTISPKYSSQPLTLPAETVTGRGWKKIFGGEFNSRANSVQQASDGGYIVTGYMGYGAKYPSGFNDTLIMEKTAAYLLKIDANGNKAWEKSFGGLGMSACSGYDNIICTLNQDNPSGWLTETVGHSVQQTSDGGYVIAGMYHSGKLHNRTSSTDYGFFEYDKGDEVYLVKTDANGDMRWNKTFGEYYNEVGYDIQQTSDSGYFIVGATNSYGTSPYSTKELGRPAPADTYLIKTDSNGNKVWDKIFGGTNIDMAFSGQQTSDGGYIVAGLTASLNGNGVEDVYLLKIDANGNKVWEKAFGRKNRSEVGYSVQQTTDGGYIIVGQTVWAVTGQWFTQSDVYLIKTDANGNEIWEKTFGGNMNDYGYSVQQTSDEGYIISGFTASFGNIGSTYLIKTDANGNKMWERIFEGGSGIAGIGSFLGGMTSVRQTSDGGYIINAGNIKTHDIETDTLSYGTGDDIYLIKTDENGNV